MEIIWTNRALDEYEGVLYYLLEKWTEKEAQRFVLVTDSVLSKIRTNPNLFKASQSYSYMRKAKITKHNSIIYQVDNEEIIILRVIDNRSEELH